MQGSDVSARLRQLSWNLRANDLEVKFQRLTRIARTKFDPNQPRVPAGNPGGGQWTSTGGSQGGATKPLTDLTRPERLQLVEVVRVCVLGGVARLTDSAGNKTYAATYDCFGGRTFVRRGIGHSPPGIVRDPFR